MLPDSDYYYQSWLTLSVPSMNNFAISPVVLVVISIFIHFCESLKKTKKPTWLLFELVKVMA